MRTLTPSPPRRQTRPLNDFRIWAGKPGYRVMSLRVGKRVAPSTFCTVLKADKLPRQEHVQAIIEACNGTREDIRLYVTAWRQIAMGRASSNGHGP